MKFFKRGYSIFLACCFATSTALAAKGDFDIEEMMSELEAEMNVSSEKLAEMRPAMEAKSEQLKKSIGTTVNEGFMELERLSDQLDAASKEAEAKLNEALNSEEMEQLKNYLNNVDGEAIEAIRESLVEELTKFLKLTEDQIKKLTPILEDGFNQLGEMLDRLAREGNKSLEEFKKQYDQLNKELNQKLKDTLDGDQLKSLDTHRDELREKIRKSLYSA